MPRFFFESTIEFIDHSFFFFNIHEEIQQRGWTMKQKIVWSCLCKGINLFIGRDPLAVSPHVLQRGYSPSFISDTLKIGILIWPNKS